MSGPIGVLAVHCRGMLWVGEREAEWGVGGWKAGRTSGLGEKGREGSVRGIFGIFQVHSSLLQDAFFSPPLSCLRPGSAAERTAGRRRKRRARLPVDLVMLVAEGLSLRVKK